MPYYRQVGQVPRKRHTQFRQPDGSLYAEELMGEEGFSAESALLYHRRLPTTITAAEPVDVEPEPLEANHPLKPRHLELHALKAGGDAVMDRRLVVGNADVALSYVAADTPSPLYRNAVGNELVYVESGAARLDSVYGSLAVGPGDYVLIPTAATHRWVPTSANGEDAGSSGEGEPLRALIVAAAGRIAPPRRYLTDRGQFNEFSPYCERDLRAPDEPLVVADAEGGDQPTDVVVRHHEGWTRYTYAHHPFDVVGWDGALYPYALNIADFEPITGRIHQPPPVHQTFAGPSFVVCSFVPRKLDYHPQAVPVPYNHANVDSDELLFYVGGEFTSRKGAGIGLGSMSLHPSGFTHGPQPGSVAASLEATETHETAVMIDTFRPLRLGPGARASEDPEYPWSWARGATEETSAST